MDPFDMKPAWEAALEALNSWIERPPLKALMTYDDIAEQLGVSRATVANWGRLGLFPVMRLGHRTVRVKAEDFREFLKTRTAASSKP